MALKREEYNSLYYGDVPRSKHLYGYSKYCRRPCSFGERHASMADYIHSKLNVAGKTILELGCAMGYLVADLRALGADAYGIDWSEYAITARPDPNAVGFIEVAEAIEFLSRSFSQIRKFDLIVSSSFLEMWNENDIPRLVRSMNRKADRQIHFFAPEFDPEFMIDRPLDWWASRGFNSGTILGHWKAWKMYDETEVK